MPVEVARRGDGLADRPNAVAADLATSPDPPPPDPDPPPDDGNELTLTH